MAEKILIVDDDPETLRLVGIMLTRQGYEVMPANSGRQAIQLASTESIDAILLDVMMPDMDGYEVTRVIRRQPESANIPILMFTAKSQVNDKVAGFEAGVDDYITKPVHPAELVAHIKTVLARGRSRPRVSSEAERGHTIGVLAAKGGLGVSTLTLNLAVTIHKKIKSTVVAAELRPGAGAWGIELGFNRTSGLNNLLQMKPGQINLSAVGNELVETSFGVRLLLASSDPKDSECEANPAQIDAILQQLPLLGAYSVLDIGGQWMPGQEKVLNHCQELVVVTESFPVAAQRTRTLIEHLQQYNFPRSKITVVAYNRMRTEMQHNLTQMQDIIGQPVALVFPPAPENAYNAVGRATPIVNQAQESAVTLQFVKLAELVLQRFGQ